MIVTVVALGIATLLFAVGSYLLIDAWMNRPRRIDLADRLAPFSSAACIAYEAEQWLSQQHEQRW